MPDEFDPIPIYPSNEGYHYKDPKWYKLPLEPWVGPDFKMLEYLSLEHPVSSDDMLKLWNTTKSYVAIEAILDIAKNNYMPVWAAWHEWDTWWRANYQPDSPEMKKPLRC